MSAHHSAGHEAGPEPHGSLRDYTIGFLLSAVLTAVPFWLVMGDVSWSKQTVAFVVMAFAAVQMVVHMVYFLHMSPKSEDGWTLTSLVFTLVLVVITLAGSLWVMYHLDSNMMPRHETQAAARSSD
jgi:cytochrome o ubiquinol oxidase subunit IV